MSDESDVQAHTCNLHTKPAKQESHCEFEANLDYTVRSLTGWAIDNVLKTNKIGETINNIFEKISMLLRSTNETNKKCFLNDTLKCTVMFQGRAELDARRSNSKPIG